MFVRKWCTSLYINWIIYIKNGCHFVQFWLNVSTSCSVLFSSLSIVNDTSNKQLKHQTLSHRTWWYTTHTVVEMFFYVWLSSAIHQYLEWPLWASISDRHLLHINTSSDPCERRSRIHISCTSIPWVTPVSVDHGYTSPAHQYLEWPIWASITDTHLLHINTLSDPYERRSRIHVFCT